MLHTSEVIDALLLHAEQILSSRTDVDLGPEPIELKVHCVQACIARPLAEVDALGELDPVCGDLYLCEAHVVGRLDYLYELRVYCGLSSGELDGRSRNGSLVSENLEHLHYCVKVGLEHVSRLVRVSETDRTAQIASVGEVDVRKTSVAQMQVAEAALKRTYLRVLDCGILHAYAVPGPLLDPPVHIDIGPDD